MTDVDKLRLQRAKLNEKFNDELYKFLDWNSKEFPWIKDFMIYRDIAWGYSKIYQYKLIMNWCRYVNDKYKNEILAEKKDFFLKLGKNDILANIADEADTKEMLETFDFDKVLHFKEIFGSKDFSIVSEKKIFTTLQILNKLSEKFMEIHNQLEKLAW
jgi:hypothetical protein